MSGPRLRVLLASVLIVASAAGAGAFAAVQLRTDAGAARPSVVVGVDDPRLRLVGRWDRSVPGAAETINAGSSLRLRTYGDQLALAFDTTRLQGTATAWVGVAATEDLPGETTTRSRVLWRVYDVADRVDVSSLLAGTGTGQRDVTVVIRSLPSEGAQWRRGGAALSLTGVEVGSAADLRYPAPVGLRLTVVGDSVTAGVGPDLADARLGYAYQAGELLFADTTVLGFVSQGVLQAGRGGVPAAADGLGLVRDGVVADEPEPDVVVVNLGTNDRFRSSAEVTRAYVDLLAQVRTLHPGAKLLALRPFSGHHGEAIAAAVTARLAAGDADLRYVDTTGWLLPDQTPDGFHPTSAGHARIAERLAGTITPLLPPA